MHARSIRVESSPDRLDRLTEAIEKEAIPALYQFPGFQGAYWFADRSSGTGLGIFFYDSAERLSQTRDRAARLRDSIAEQTGAKFTEVKELEVIADTGRKIHTRASHARVSSIQGDPSRRAETVQHISESILPNLQRMDGFQGGVWLLDLGGGPSHAVTLWEGQASLDQTRPRADQLRSQSSAQIGADVRGVEEFEIAARAEAPAGGGA